MVQILFENYAFPSQGKGKIVPVLN